MKNLLTERWQRCSRREQCLLLIAAIAILLLLLKLFSLPLQHYREQAARQVLQAQQELSWLQQHREAITLFLARHQSAATSQQAAAVMRSAQAINLPISVQPLPDNNSISITAQGPLSFPQLMAWLITLNESAGLQVKQLDIESTPRGITLLRLELQNHD